MRIFLSYGRRDASDLADRLRTDLEAADYDIWQDTRHIRSGKDWQQEIEDGLRQSQVFVALLSPHAVRRSGTAASPDDLDSVCLDEISLARFGRPPTPIVPVMAVRCDPPLAIYRLDYVDFTSWKESEQNYRTAFNRLVRNR
jgi:hypothetical protein